MNYLKASDSVKSLGDGKIGGYLIRFGSETQTDLEGDFFAPDTDLGQFKTLPLMYHHGFDAVLKNKPLKSATGETIFLNHKNTDEVGHWYEAQLNLADAYQAYLNQLAVEGKLGFSSGAAAHTVTRLPSGKAMKITQWFLAEASLTPTPAEPQNIVQEVKSLDMGRSLSSKVNEVREAFYNQNRDGNGLYMYVAEVFEDMVLVDVEGSFGSISDGYYAIEYTRNDQNEIVFGSDWTKYEKQIIWNKVEAKALKSVYLEALGKSGDDDGWDEVRQLIKQIEG